MDRIGPFSRGELYEAYSTLSSFMYLLVEKFCPLGRQKAMRNRFTNMKQGTRQLINFLMQKLPSLIKSILRGSPKIILTYFMTNFC